MIHIGCAGYAYDDWKGRFYPAGLPPRERLPFYAKRFGFLEINSTYYRPPTADQVAGWAGRVPEGFGFAVKAHQQLTHDHTAASDADFTSFAEALGPMRERGQLKAVLLQFPNAFRLCRDHVAYLRRVRRAWPALPLVIEFRHESWVDERTYDFLAEQGLAWCCVDEPTLPGLPPTVVRSTAAPAYVRFHGRNAARWYNHAEAWQRYDYLYSREELEPWIERIRALDSAAGEVCVVFNNHYDGQAPLNAEQLAEMLAIDPTAPP